LTVIWVSTSLKKKRNKNQQAPPDDQTLSLFFCFAY
jgi:hypothetical protein